MRPTIGIRPIIDGRCMGVRESLEEQTMNLALSAKKLIEDNIFYTDGTPVRVIVANGTIAGGKEAADCAEKFEANNVVATLYMSSTRESAI